MIRLVFTIWKYGVAAVGAKIRRCNIGQWSYSFGKGGRGALGREVVMLEKARKREGLHRLAARGLAPVVRQAIDRNREGFHRWMVQSRPARMALEPLTIARIDGLDYLLLKDD
ncbi:hypothetical protein BHM03_00056277 [Ensete ventricosum]|nr:hypothetical protein BHM03_00056277 [Ensete ventricosum]